MHLLLDAVDVSFNVGTTLNMKHLLYDILRQCCC